MSCPKPSEQLFLAGSRQSWEVAAHLAQWVSVVAHPFVMIAHMVAALDLLKHPNVAPKREKSRKFMAPDATERLLAPHRLAVLPCST